MTIQPRETTVRNQDQKSWTIDRSCVEKLDEALVFAQVFVKHEDNGIGILCGLGTIPEDPVEGVQVGVCVANEEGASQLCFAESPQGGMLSVARSAEEGGPGWFVLLEDDRPLFHVLEFGADLETIPRNIERLFVVGSGDLSGLAGMERLEMLAIFSDPKLEGLSTVFTLPALTKLKLDGCLHLSPEGLVMRLERSIGVTVFEQVAWRGDIRDVLEDGDDD